MWLTCEVYTSSPFPATFQSEHTKFLPGAIAREPKILIFNMDVIASILEIWKRLFLLEHQ